MENEKIKEIIGGMSVLEKARQLTQIDATTIIKDDEATVTGNCGNLNLSREDVDGIGSVLNFSGAEKAIELQTEHLKHSAIPLILMQDVVHGYRTIFPLNIAIGGTFDLELAERCAEISAIEAKANGVMVTFAPMVDLVRDARWGRVMESTGEDPYLNGLMGRAFIRGFKKGGLAVCIKHFAAYGACEAGKDYNTTEIGEYSLRNYYLKGYEECLKEEPEMVMTSFNLLNGVPVNGHGELLLDLLRGEWGFTGVTISDYDGVREMINHGYCADLKKCALVAANNEVDIEMTSPSYIRHLPELIEEGKVALDKINAMLYRVLTLKNRLGLFENPLYGTDAENNFKVLPKAHREFARIAAEKSCVLLKNENALPLTVNEKVCLVGPFADEQSIIGNWKCLGKIEEAVSVKTGMETLLNRTVPFAMGCSVEFEDNDYGKFADAESIASVSDTIIVCIGERSDYAGEGVSRSKLSLPKVQLELVKRLNRLGKKTVLVVFGGRPQVLTEVEAYVNAILYVWQPGTEGGTAIANLLYGECEPCGKITMSFPRTTGQCPVYYNYFNTGRPKIPDTSDNFMFKSSYIDSLNSPLYPFGFGLTYTEFEMSDIKLSDNKLVCGGSITASVRIKNIGQRRGEEVVQLYIRDKFASVVRPVKELKAFKKVKLEPAEETDVSFNLDEEMLKFYTASRRFEAEKGEFELMVGFNSRDVKRVNFILY